MKCVVRVLMASISLLFAVACTEEIVIDIEKGDPMVGVEAYLSNELKCHEAILSYTADFYNKDDIRMISGATVYVTDEVDTIYYYEDVEQEGHYFTEPVAGKKNTLYHLCVDMTDVDGERLHFFAESLLPDNVEHIDSLVIKPYNGVDDTVPSTTFYGDTIEWVYPYFQSLPDPTIIYAPSVYKNDTLLNDTLTQQMMIPVGGYAGFYINGPEMQEANKEIPVYVFMKKDLKPGDHIRVVLRSLPTDYLYYFYTLAMSTGSNPMLGAPSNVATNIQPVEKGVGWFFTESVVSVETIFEDK